MYNNYIGQYNPRTNRQPKVLQPLLTFVFEPSWKTEGKLAAGLDFAHAKPFNMKLLPISIFPCRGGKTPMKKPFIISEYWQYWNQRELAHT